MALRPDALLNRSENAGIRTGNNDYDSRAGRVYHNTPVLSFLESWHLEFIRKPGFHMRAGVREALWLPSRAFEDLTEFGLQVHLPRNFFAATLLWDPSGLSGSAALAPQDHHQLEFVLMHGPGDRSELMKYSGTERDRAPATGDPFGGLSLAYRLASRGLINAGVLAGYHESGHSKGQVRSLYGDCFIHHPLDTWPWKSQIHWNLRYFKDSPRGWQISAPERTQLSLSLTSRSAITGRACLLFGLSAGRADFFSEILDHANATHIGHQIEAGLWFRQDEALTWQLLVAEEHRQKTDGENNATAAFVWDEGSRKMIRRFSAGLTWSGL